MNQMDQPIAKKKTNALPGCCFADSLASRSRPTGKVGEILKASRENDAFFISYFSCFFV